jgi:hypothetical protein
VLLSGWARWSIRSRPQVAADWVVLSWMGASRSTVAPPGRVPSCAATVVGSVTAKPLSAAV